MMAEFNNLSYDRLDYIPYQSLRGHTLMSLVDGLCMTHVALMCLVLQKSKICLI